MSIAAESHRAIVGKELAGYRLDALRGIGSVGAVYRATQLATGRTVAVKRLFAKTQADRETVKRIEREFAVSCELDHPHIVRNLSLETSVKPYMLVMDYIDGPDALQYIQKGTYRLSAVLRIGAEVARALGYLHAKGLIHRDVKPSNILIDDRGDVHTAKLGDLGLLKGFGSQEGTALTAAGVVMGTPSYLALEVIVDNADPSPFTDVYSLGATLYHLMAGHPPFEGGSPYEIFREALDHPPTPLSKAVKGLPAPVVEFVERLMSKDPSKRIVRGDEIARRLDEFAATLK